MNNTNTYRLLIIEDNPGDYFLVCEHLQMTGLPIADIFHAESMTQAGAIITENTFDIALLDLSLHDSNGVDSVITLDRWLPKTAIVVLSGLSTVEVAREAISLGAQDYLVKGEFDDRLLAKTIQYSIDRKKSLVDAAAEKVRHQKVLTEVALQAQQKEKEDIGRELHDNINQVLATVKMYLGLIKSGKAEEPDELLGKSLEYVEYAIDELRKLSHSLVAPAKKSSTLINLLEELVYDINSFKRMTIKLEIGDEISGLELDKDIELMIYRVLQEQLNNIVKYAHAKETLIRLESESGILYLTIKDDGEGFDATSTSKGIGLRNIQSRVDHHGGDLQLISAPGKGCTLEVSVKI